MTDNIKLPPLPEWTKRDDLDGLLPSEVRVEMFTYLRANMEPLRQKLRRLTFELDAATIEKSLRTIADGAGRGNTDFRPGIHGA